MNALTRKISSIDRRQSDRTNATDTIRIRSVGNVYANPSERVSEAKYYWGRMCNMSHCGMCVASNTLFAEDTVLYIFMTENSENVDKRWYTGVIIWNKEMMDKERYCFGIEFLCSWIRRKLYRKQIDRKSVV